MANADRNSSSTAAHQQQEQPLCMNNCSSSSSSLHKTGNLALLIIRAAVADRLALSEVTHGASYHFAA